MHRTDYRSTLRCCCMCYFAQAVSVHLSPVLFGVFHRLYGLDFALLGMLAGATFLSQLVIDLVSAPLCNRLGYRNCMALALACCTVGLLLLGTLVRVSEHAFAALAASTVCFAVGGGLLEVVVSPVAEAVADKARTRGTMGLLFSFYSWGQTAVVLLTSLTLYFLDDTLWYWTAYIWAIVPFVALLGVGSVPFPPHVPCKTRMRDFRLTPHIALSMAVMLCAGAGEMIVSQWSSVFAETALGLPKLLGDLTGVCAFAACMGLGRLTLALRPPRNPARTMQTSAILLCAAFAMLACVPHAIVCQLACAVAGWAVSRMWPLTVSECASHTPHSGPMLFALLAVSGDIGCTLGPALLGKVSDWAQTLPQVLTLAESYGQSAEQVAMRVGIAATFGFPLLLCVLLLLLPRMRRRGQLPLADSTERTVMLLPPPDPDQVETAQSLQAAPNSHAVRNLSEVSADFDRHHSQT